MSKPISRRVSRTSRTSQRGMTLLEIMIVIAIIAVVAAVVAPRVFDAFGETKAETTKISVQRVAKDWYPRWMTKNSDKSCPDSLLEVGRAVDSTIKESELNDAWGRPLKFLCGPTLPEGVKGLAVYSLGEDGTENTADDIKSW